MAKALKTDKFLEFVQTFIDERKITPDDIFDFVENEDGLAVNLPTDFVDEFIEKYPGTSIEETVHQYIRSIIDELTALKEDELQKKFEDIVETADDLPESVKEIFREKG